MNGMTPPMELDAPKKPRVEPCGCPNSSCHVGSTCIPFVIDYKGSMLTQVSNSSLSRQLTPSIPSAALASSDDVSKKYSKMPFLRLQNGGIDARSIGDEMPSTVCAAEGAIIWPLLSLPRLRRSVEARVQPGLSSDARSDGSRAIVQESSPSAKKSDRRRLLSQPVAILGVGASHSDSSGQLPLRQPQREAIRRLNRESSRITDGHRQIDKAKAVGRSVSVHASCRRTPSPRGD